MYNTYSKYFFLNGEKYSTFSSLTLSKIIKYFNYNSTLLVIEYNNSIYNKKYWNKIKIKNNDKIEIITIVGGG